jgi:hypothetical protein
MSNQYVFILLLLYFYLFICGILILLCMYFHMSYIWFFCPTHWSWKTFFEIVMSPYWFDISIYIYNVWETSQRSSLRSVGSLRYNDTIQVKYIRNFTTAFFTYIANVNIISEFNFFSFMDIHVIFYKKQFQSRLWLS